MSENLKIWDALAKTDPKHTKPFKRAGGFSGTAIKPIWIVKMLTEQFGPCGVGWGTNEPKFDVVPCEGEILVFCTVSGWHGSRDNTVWGVGGDKVMAKRKDGAFCDDEAFKKAHTDAIGNAFKLLGVGADVHMGQFDDSKYREEIAREFAEPPPAPAEESESLKQLRRTMKECTSEQECKAWLKKQIDAINMLDDNERVPLELEYIELKAGFAEVSKLLAA